MNRIFTILILLTMLFTVSCKDNISYEPMKNHGKKWQIAYYQGGDYTSYPAYTKQVVKSLCKLGWIEPFVYPKWDKDVQMKEVWDWLSENIKSDYIEFRKDAFYSSDWDRETRLENKKDFIKRLNTKNDIDLIFALGTWAGQDLANNEHHTPVEIMSVTNPIESDIIASKEDSGYDHITAGFEPDRFQQQIRLFHDIVHFKRLGIVMEDSNNGRTYVNYNDLKMVAIQRHFKIIEAYAPEEKTCDDVCAEKYYNALRSIVDKVDAVWIGPHTGSQPQYIKKIADLLIEKKIPSWSQQDNGQVEKGLLFSISPDDFEKIGMFDAQKIARILRGEKPRDLPLIFSSRLGLSINMDTAVKIGFKVPKGVLSVADRIYER